MPQDANGISGELVSEEYNDERAKAASEFTKKLHICKKFEKNMVKFAYV